MEITYTPDSISFDCTNCGAKLVITRHSPDSIISGTFCQGCDEQYYTRWDGMLHRGPIEVSVPPMIEASTTKEIIERFGITSPIVGEIG